MAVGIQNVNMSIYTKTGDDGTTSLYNGKRVLKSDPLINACGNIDELTSFIGLVKNKLKSSDKNKTLLLSIQKDLHQIMAVLAGSKRPIVDLNQKVKLFEQMIDKTMSRLPEIKSFILPGGTEMSAWFHILRTVCRRAERRVVGLKIENGKLKIVIYLNRLSDLFFTLSRWYGRNKEVIIK